MKFSRSSAGKIILVLLFCLMMSTVAGCLGSGLSGTYKDDKNRKIKFRGNKITLATEESEVTQKYEIKDGQLNVIFDGEIVLQYKFEKKGMYIYLDGTKYKKVSFW